MKKIILLFCALALIVSCTEQPYYEIPLNSDGTVYLTGVPVATSPGISTLDGGFTVTATFVSAKAGDVMNVELLQLQDVAGSATKQLLPMAGTQQTVSVGSDMKATVTYTRAVAMLAKATDYVTVVFNGDTDYAKLRVNMVAATTVTKPKVGTKEIDVARTSEVANFNVTIAPKEAAYTGTLVVEMKNGVNDPLVELAGSPFAMASPILVPISGDDFAVGKDTAYFVFTATVGSYVDEITYKVIVRDPYFYLKKTATINLNKGRYLFANTECTEDADTAHIALVNTGSLVLQGGSAWLTAGNTIEFVPTTIAEYDKNNSTTAKATFDAVVVPATFADPSVGGAWIYKIVNGPDPEDVYYGMFKATAVVPGASVTIEYRIGDQYAHLLVIK